MIINSFQGLSRIWQETITQFKTNIKSGKWKISHPIQEKEVNTLRTGEADLRF